MVVTGSAAILLMALHLAWAAGVLLRGDERARARFHRFSMAVWAVWAVWLVPYAAGALGAVLS